MVRFLLLILTVFFLYSCSFDNSLIAKRLDLLEQRVNFNSKRIEDNSKKIDNIQAQIEKIKERLAKEREQNNLLAQIPPAIVIDNLTDEHKDKTKTAPKKPIKITVSTKTDNNTTEIPSKEQVLNKVGKAQEITASKTKASIDPESLYKQALSLYFNKQYLKAKELFFKFLNTFNKNNPLYDNAMFWLGYCYIHMNMADKAIETFERLIKEFPNGSVDNGGKTDAAIYALIKIYRRQGNTNLVKKYERLLLKHFPYSVYSSYVKRGLKG